MFDIASGTFMSPSLVRREERIQAARRDSLRCLRDLRRDRTDLERREKQLMAQLKSYVKKGDFPKANLLAKQIALFRNLTDKNFERSVSIQTDVQLSMSNQRIHRAQAESIKALCFANLGETLDMVRDREHKYQLRISEYEAIEDIMNEGFDEIYENIEVERPKPESFERQIEAVFLEAVNPSDPMNRDHLAVSGSTKVFNGRVYIQVKSYSQLTEASAPQAIVFIPTLDVSVDMLKQLILRDKRAAQALGLNNDRSNAFQVGDLMRFVGDDNSSVSGGESRTSVTSTNEDTDTHVRFHMDEDSAAHSTHNDRDQPKRDSFDHGASFSYKFVPFDIRESLKSLGIKNGGNVWINIIN